VPVEVPIRTDRETFALDLRTYGEEELAAQVASMSDEDLERVSEPTTASIRTSAA
jgi:hypothetical protein